MNYRILFIEDDYMTIDSTVTHLELSGHEVHICEDVSKALFLLMNETFSFIFLDVMLPPGELFSLTETADGRYTGLRLLELVFSDDRCKLARESHWFFITNWREEPEVDSVALKTGIRILRKPLTIANINEVMSL